MTRSPSVGAWRVALVLLKVGVLAFGGPAAHVALMRRELVDRRRWIDEDTFFRMFAACNLVPGPSSTELAIFLGYRLGGWPGLALSGALFIAPATAIMVAIAWLYVRLGPSPPLHAVLAGVRPVVVGIVAWAALDLGRRLVTSVPLGALAAAVGAAALAGASPVLLLFAGGVAWLAFSLGRERAVRGVSSVLPALPLPKLVTLFLTFLKLGAVAFGTGYVLFALLRAEFVDGLHWLTERQLVDAVAISQVTPGPVFTTATFLGYLFAGLPGAGLATLGMFLPAFALVPFLDRVVRLVESRRRLRVLLDGVNAAALGVIAAVAVQLGAASLDGAWTVAVALASFAVLLRFPLATPALVVAGGLLGLALGPA
jgi:chromate transporter